MRKLMLIMVAILLVSFVAVACGSRSSGVSEGPVPAPIPAPAPMPAPAPPKVGSSPVEAPPPTIIIQDGSGAVIEERMIIRTGNMSLVVEDVVEARDEIAGLAARLGGYVVSTSISGEEEGMRGDIVIRVPDDTFEEALSELRGLAVRVRSENTGSQDVTEEYVDLQSRLSNAEATEAQYLEVLEKATDVEDILNVYQRLSEVRREIEQLKGRMQYLERLTSMSLISVSLRPEVSDRPLASAGWSALEILKSAVRGIITFGQWLVTALIWVVIFSPVWGGIIGLIYWRLRKRRAAS